MVDASKADSSGEWEVVAARPHNRGDAAGGVEETVLVAGPEDEARRVYAEEVATAAGQGYEYVRLRCAGQDVDFWPPKTGWTC